jgi:hypothetical protein
VLRASIAAEKAGVPSVSLVTSGFMRQAVTTARALGSPDLSLVEYPGVIPLDSAEQLEEKVRTVVLDAVISSLGLAVEPDGWARTAEPGRDEVVFRGSLHEVVDHFHEQGWTDGLPIIPPTRESVQAFLRWTEREPHELLGVLPPEGREATVWNVAVNGVMAGCRPEYMPVLLAVVEAIADPEFGLEHGGSTLGWEPVVVLSGRLGPALGFNVETGVMRVGSQANTSIGRFLRLVMRNLAGFKPGTTDKGSIGATFHVALAENEAAVRELGWDPFRVDRGFALEDEVVTVQSVVAVSMPCYSGGSTAASLIGPLTHFMGLTIGPYAFSALWYSRWHPLILMSPAVAAGFAADGWGKDEIRRHLFEHLKIEARWLEHYPLHIAGQEVPLAQLVADGVIPPSYTESDDPERLLPMLLREEWTGIVLAGDPGRNQSRIYVNNHEQGAPVSRRIELPEDWERRLARGR